MVSHTTLRSGTLRVRLFWGCAVALPLAFLSFFFVWPVGSLIVTGVTGTLVPSGAAAPWEVLTHARTWHAIAHTLLQATLATAGSLVLGIPLAFVLYRLNFVGRGPLRALVTVPFVLPTVVVAVAFTALFGESGVLGVLGWERSLQIIVLALMFFNVTVVVRTVGGFWAQLDPRATQAARTLGAGPLRAWLTVTAPALAPSIAAAAALVFLFCSTSFGVVLVLGGREFSTIETEIYRLAMQYLDLTGAAVLSVVQLLVVAAVMWVSTRLAGRQHRHERHRHVQHRFVAQRVRPSREHLPAVAVAAATVLVLHVAPIAALLWQSVRDPAGGFTLSHYLHLVAPPEGVTLSASVGAALLHSVQIAVWATLISVMLGVALTLVVTRCPRQPWARRGIAVIDATVMLPLGVSAVVLGLGLLLTMHEPFGMPIDLRSSPVLLPVAQALVAFPLVVRMLVPSVRSIDARLRDAAATLGASPLRVLRTIDLAMLGRASGLALGCALATSLGEFGASSFLVRPGATTLPVLIAELVGRPGAVHYGMALAAAVLLGAVTAAIMVVAERVRGEEIFQW